MLLDTYKTRAVPGAARLLPVVMSVMILLPGSRVVAGSANPFEKVVEVAAGGNVSWQFGDQSATKSVQGPDGTWYHLFYDGLRLRLRLTESAVDSEQGAKQFEGFAVHDVRIDRARPAVFQWCLNNQERHSRFLEQGLSVKKGICQNQGEQGAFVMRLTRDTIEALDNGKRIEYELKPYRTTVRVSFGIGDFDQVNSEFRRQKEERLAASRPKPAPAAVVPPAVVVEAKPLPKPKCKLDPPEGYPELQSVKYSCDDIADRINAQAAMELKVEEVVQQRRREAEAERIRQLDAARLREQDKAARRKAEEALRKEQEALAASAAIQAELSSDITRKMISVCEKSWAEGKHRCYCEKYIKFAPPGIESDPSCQ